MDRRLGDVKEFEFKQPPKSALTAAGAADDEDGDAEVDGLVVCVCVSGFHAWLSIAYLLDSTTSGSRHSVNSKAHCQLSSTKRHWAQKANNDNQSFSVTPLAMSLILPKDPCNAQCNVSKGETIA